jgi:hypothetical protein
MTARTAFPCAVVFLLLGCGQSTNMPVSASVPTSSKSDVIVTIDGRRHSCVVALPTEETGSIVACDEVVAFVRDELKVPNGSVYEIRTIPNVDKDESARVETNLNGAGYRLGGVRP